MSPADLAAAMKANMGLVGLCLRRMKPKPSDVEDMKQAGAIGLLHALRTHDPSRAALSTWAIIHIRGEMQQARDKRRAGLKGVGKTAPLHIVRGDEFSVPDLLPDPEHALIQKQEEALLARQIAEHAKGLPEGQRAVLDATLRGEESDEIARKGGSTSVAVSKIRYKVAKKIGTAIASSNTSHLPRVEKPKPKAVKVVNPNTAVGYLRVSTDDQALGLEAQRTAIISWAAKAGVEIVAWHSDEGVSGSADIEARPGLVAALGQLRADGVGLLVIAKRDRLARDVYIAGAITRAVESSCARVVCADGVGNGETPADQFMRTILDAAAAYERALIRTRIKAALAVKKTRGERVGGVPFGQRVEADVLVPEPREMAIVEEARALHGQGLSAYAIAKRGLVSPRTGRPLMPTQIARMLG